MGSHYVTTNDAWLLPLGNAVVSTRWYTARHARGRLRWVRALLRHCRERVLSRQQLRILCKLDDHILQDIALNRAALRYEAKKPFWQ